QVRQHRVVHGTGNGHERASGLRDPHQLGLATGVPAAVDARGLHAVAAVHTRVVAVHERCDDEVADREVRDLGADALHDAHELVTDLRRLGLGSVQAAVGPQVAAAHAGGDSTDDGVRVGLEDGVL